MKNNPTDNLTQDLAWLDVSEPADYAKSCDLRKVVNSLQSDAPDEKSFAALLSPAAAEVLEPMAQKAQLLTRRHFGQVIALYAPLYLSSYCQGGCVYCGFAADRKTERHKLEMPQILKEIAALKKMGIDDVLLLTGQRTPHADFDYLLAAVEATAKTIPAVGVEAFSMSIEEYEQLAAAGCTAITVYQETYDMELYHTLHRWGEKKDFKNRVDAPSRALSGGIRNFGLGVLLGLADPIEDILRLYRHVRYLQKKYWKAGISISFPRIRPQEGDYAPNFSVDERQLAQIIFAFRICLPTVTLVLSTRERAVFRNGMAGVGINRMSAASRTTVGGYADAADQTLQNPDEKQFEISDKRDMLTFCQDLELRNLQPVHKNWDAVYR